MTEKAGKELAKDILNRMIEFKKTCFELDEDSASKAPEGRWSPKQIISHLCGPEGKGRLLLFKNFLERDNPEIMSDPENPYWSEKRSKMSVAELLVEFEREYKTIAQFIESLSDEQLSRKAHIPRLKDSPLGEYPTLSEWARRLAVNHITFHIDHMREIMRSIGPLKTSG